MCTVVVLIRPRHAWPLVMAANRDEMVARAWASPAEHWPDRLGVVAGRDLAGGGTWMGINRHGVIAAVLNRPGSLGPAPGRRSRGGLPLRALEYRTASAAAAAIAAEDATSYRSFNMVLADRRGAWFVRAEETGHPVSARLTPGLHMVTAHDPDDDASPRTARHLPRFRTAAAPDPGRDDWRAWESLLADHSGPPGTELTVPERGGFATICASLLAIPAQGQAVWQFAPGPAGQTGFDRVALPRPAVV